jgi:serine/threonine-protein kinase RsbW
MSASEQPSIPNNTMEIEVCCQAASGVLATLRQFAVCLARNAGFDEVQVGEIEMAVDEACANVIRHAYKHLGVSPDLGGETASNDDSVQEKCTIRLRASIKTDRLVLSVVDQGIGLYRMPPGVESVQEYQERGGSGGLGIYIIRQYMDEIEYHYPPESGTVLTMVKYLRRECNRVVS